MSGKVLSENQVSRRAGLDRNDEEKQHIYVTDNDELSSSEFFSVTTALSHWDNPEKKAAIEGWKKKNNGEDGTEHHEDLLRYAQLRGTLCHAKAQEKYADEQVWSGEEDLAEEQLQNFGEFKDQDAYDKYTEDVKWFVDEIHSLLDSEIQEVVYVEAYCFNDTPAYAGQVDLVYRNTDGELVVCDLKTSKQVAYSYLLQSNAYARVIESELGEPVQKLQVARANPDHKSSELYTVDRDSMSIRATDIIQGKYGYRVLIETPYRAKTDLNSLNWDLYHQKWNSEHGKWSLAVRNKNDTVTIDLAFDELTKKGWTVNIPKGIKQRLIHQCGVDSTELCFENIENPFKSYGHQLTEQFDELVDIENENKPIQFAEDILDEHADHFDSEVYQRTREYIIQYQGELGDKHPYEICAASLNLHGADTETIHKIFDPDNLEENTELYNNQNPPQQSKTLPKA